jgi:hypothetical protein
MSRVTTVARVRSRCSRYIEYIFDPHTSKTSRYEPKVELLHLWGVNVKTTSGFIHIPLADFFTDNCAITILRVFQILYRLAATELYIREQKKYIYKNLSCLQIVISVGYLLWD